LATAAQIPSFVCETLTFMFTFVHYQLFIFILLQIIDNQKEVNKVAHLC